MHAFVSPIGDSPHHPPKEPSGERGRWVFLKPQPTLFIVILANGVCGTPQGSSDTQTIAANGAMAHACGDILKVQNKENQYTATRQNPEQQKPVRKQNCLDTSTFCIPCFRFRLRWCERNRFVRVAFGFLFQ